MLSTQIISALVFSALVTSVNAAGPVESRDVYSPKVLYPHAGTVWYSGQRHNVTWYAAYIISLRSVNTDCI